MDRYLPCAALLLLLGCRGGNEPVDDTEAEEAQDSEPIGHTDPHTDPPGPRWATAAALPEPRQEHGVAVLRGELVVVGGLVGGPPPTETDSVIAWNPTTDTWRSLASLPRPVHHPNVGVVGDTLVVAGFLTGEDFLPDATVWRYDADADAWTEGASVPTGTARGAAVTLAWGDELLVIGGLSSLGPSNIVQAYHPGIDAWRTLPPMPTAREHAAGAVLDDRIVVVGGRLGYDNELDVVEAWSPEEGWTTLAPLPRARGGLVAGTVNGLVYALGGEGNPDDPGMMFDDLDVYDPATDVWTPLEAMPSPVHGTVAAVLDARLHVPGGGSVAGYRPVDALQVFDPSAP